MRDIVGQPSQVPSNVDPVSGLFICTHPGCEKTFTRKDHLVRHSSNHSPTEHRCPNCDKAFKRLDLLQRHLDRRICQGCSPRSTSNESTPFLPLYAESIDGYDRAKRAKLDTGVCGIPIGGNMFADGLPPLQSPFRADLSFPRPPQISPFIFGHPQQQDTENIYQVQPPFNQGHSVLSPIRGSTASSSQTPLIPSTPFPQISPYPTTSHARSLSVPFPSTLSNVPDFEIGPTQTWSVCNQDVFAPPVGEALIDSIASGLPLHQDARAIDTNSWGSMPMPRLQEASEITPDPHISQALVNRLTTSYPEMQVSVQWVTDAIESYWTNIAPSFPFIHRGTFDIEKAPSALVAMMAISGSTHFPPPVSDFSKTVKSIRGELVTEFGPHMPISTLSTFCLCHVYDTFYGDNETLFVAQCMWPIMVMYARKIGIGVFSPPAESDDEFQAEEAWVRWAKIEEVRRAAYCVLLVDTQLSAFWNQHPSRQLSIFAHDLALPCPKYQWEAMTPGQWVQLRTLETAQSPASAMGVTPNLGDMNDIPTACDSSSPVKTPRKRNRSFHPGLHPNFTVKIVADGYSDCLWRTFAADSSLALPVDLGHALGVQSIMMGLLAIAWDCRTRGGMGLIFKNGMDKWRVHVLNAVINLRAAWENAIQHLSPTVESRDMRDMFGIAVVSVLSDVPMLQAAAGATSICGATIHSGQFTDAQRRLRIWASQPDAYTCLWQSARFLQSALMADWGLYTPWAVYLVTLIHWGYAWAQIPGGQRLTPPSSDYCTAGLRACEAIVEGRAASVSLDTLGVLDLVALAAERLRSSGHPNQIVTECADLLGGLLSGVVEGKASEAVKREDQAH